MLGLAIREVIDCEETWSQSQSNKALWESIMLLLRSAHKLSIALAFLVTTSTLPAQEDVGPMVGHVDTNSARLLLRRGG